MSTRSFVGVMVGDVCRAVYVHFDGYLSGVGAALQDYTTQAAAEELISHGDRSTLNSEYYKDRGETDVEPIDYATFEEFYNGADYAGAEWYYIFNNGQWLCGNTYDGSKLYKTLVPYTVAVGTYAAECKN